MIETKLNNLEINELTEEQYHSAKASGSLNSDAFYMTEANEEIPVIPIAKGGTNAQTVQEARTNLGFEYGSEAPTHVPETGDGAIYFKIDDDDNGILSIEEGGTGAITGYDALRNLGAMDYVVEQGTDGIWTYRKWASGIAECWAYPHNTTFTADGQLMGGYLFRGGYAFPSGLFLEAPEGYVNGHSGTGVGWGEFRNATKDAFTAYICGNQNLTSVTVSGMRATGRWK